MDRLAENSKLQQNLPCSGYSHCTRAFHQRHLELNPSFDSYNCREAQPANQSNKQSTVPQLLPEQLLLCILQDSSELSPALPLHISSPPKRNPYSSESKISSFINRLQRGLKHDSSGKEEFCVYHTSLPSLFLIRHPMTNPPRSDVAELGSGCLMSCSWTLHSSS